MLETQLADSLIQERLLAMLPGFFGMVALLTAGIGLYGMVSVAVARRRNELGVRMALGARSRDIVWLVLRDLALITALGLIAGAALAFASGRLVTTLLTASRQRIPRPPRWPWRCSEASRCWPATCPRAAPHGWIR